jgi:hypothetical protein
MQAIQSPLTASLSRVKKKMSNSASNPTHNPIAVFLPHLLYPNLSSPANTSAGPPLDGLELEAAAIELFAEVQSSRRSGVYSVGNHIIRERAWQLVGGEVIETAC